MSEGMRQFDQWWEGRPDEPMGGITYSEALEVWQACIAAQSAPGGISAGMTARIAALENALNQLLDDLSAGTMVFPGHSVCQQAWDEALTLLPETTAKRQEVKG